MKKVLAIALLIGAFVTAQSLVYAQEAAGE